MKLKETSLVKQFVKTQFKNPKRKDWANTVKDNLEELELKLTIKSIEEMPKKTYKEMIKRRIKEKNI